MTAPSTSHSYIVFPGDEDFPGPACRLVNAATAEDAKTLYIERVLARDEAWQQHVYTRSAHEGFARSFFIEAGTPLFDEQGEWLAGHEQARATFERNVRRYFGPHTAWADLYLKFYFTGEPLSWQEARSRWPFPEAMVGYMFTRRRDPCEILVVGLDEIEVLA